MAAQGNCRGATWSGILRCVNKKLLVTRASLLVSRASLLVTRASLLVSRASLLVASASLLVARALLLVAYNKYIPSLICCPHHRGFLTLQAPANHVSNSSPGRKARSLDDTLHRVVHKDPIDRVLASGGQGAPRASRTLLPRGLLPRASLLLVVMPGAPSSFLLLVAMPFAPSSVLVTSSKARSP